jgi:glycerol-3-phosphate responsive antiterminator
MEVEEDVMNQIVRQVHTVNQINVKHTEVVEGVLNKVVNQVPEKNQINVQHMEEEKDVQIVSIGLIQDVEL